MRGRSHSPLATIARLSVPYCQVGQDAWDKTLVSQAFCCCMPSLSAYKNHASFDFYALLPQSAQSSSPPPSLSPNPFLHAMETKRSVYSGPGRCAVRMVRHEVPEAPRKMFFCKNNRIKFTEQKKRLFCYVPFRSKSHGSVLMKALVQTRAAPRETRASPRHPATPPLRWAW